jgi:hypothetical protein
VLPAAWALASAPEAMPLRRQRLHAGSKQLRQLASPDDEAQLLLEPSSESLQP